MRKRNFKQKEYLYVDGYNIINSWDSLKTKKRYSLEEARIELLEILSEYHHYSGIDITVVFDAYDVKNNNGKIEAYKGITVVYTKEYETADHYIERELDSLGKIRNIRVATSDRLEQEMILSRGGIRLSARELELEILNEMNMIKKKSRHINKQNDIYLGRLDEATLKKLNRWNKSKDKS